MATGRCETCGGEYDDIVLYGPHQLCPSDKKDRCRAMLSARAELRRLYPHLENESEEFLDGFVSGLRTTKQLLDSIEKELIAVEDDLRNHRHVPARRVDKLLMLLRAK